MATKELLNQLDALLQPVSASSHAGEWLKYEGTYDRIQQARKEEPELSQGVWQRESKKADWAAVESLCIEALTNRTKDLQIAVWLLESWINLYGLQGLMQGLQLINHLHDSFWSTMFPPADDLEYRVSQLAWINEKLPTAVKFTEISAPMDRTMMPVVTFASWEAAQHTERTVRGASKNADTSKSTLLQLQQSIVSTPSTFYSDLWEQLNGALDACSDLDANLDRLYGSQNPGLRQMYEVLESIVAVIRPLVEHTLPNARHETEDQPDGYPPEIEAALPTIHTAIRSRNEAYRCLAEVADFLSRTEPHSPVPYLIRRAITWGSMDLDQLLPELLNHEAALNDVVNLLQIHSFKK